MIKNPTGDSMSKAPNLVDLFANRKDALPKAGQPADARKAASARGSRSESFPLESTAGKSEGGSKPSFQARVKESRAKLAAGSHKFFSQAKAPESQATDAASAAQSGASAKSKGPTDSEAAKRGESVRPEGSGRARKRSRSEEGASDPQADAGTGDDRMDRSQPSAGHSRKASQASQGPAPIDETAAAAGEAAESLDAPAVSGSASAASKQEAAIEELKSGLESLGITVTREQLDDPVFLADILVMLQNLGAPLAMQAEAAVPAMPESLEAEPAEGAQPAIAAGFPAMEAKPAISDATSTAAASGALGADGPVPEENPAAPAGTLAAAGSETADPLFSNKEAAALIRDRIAELTRNVSDEGAAAGRPANVPTTTPGAWQGVTVRPHAESLSVDPLPMADLDKLRVLQASALQANAAGKENSPALSLESDSEASDLADEGEISYLPSADESNATEGDSDTGLSGRKEEGLKNPDFAVRREGTGIAKDGIAGSQFVNTLDQARAPEHRSAVPRAWAPHQPAFEKNVLDQISRKMSGAGLKSGEELSIQLAPENLGKVRISLEMKEGVMSARIGVENESVRQIVESNLAGLRDSLETQGVKLQGLDVSVDQRHGSLFNPDGSNAESFFQRNGRKDGGGSAGRETPAFEAAPESDTGRRLGYNTLEYIG